MFFNSPRVQKAKRGVVCFTCESELLKASCAVMFSKDCLFILFWPFFRLLCMGLLFFIFLPKLVEGTRDMRQGTSTDCQTLRKAQ